MLKNIRRFDDFLLQLIFRPFTFLTHELKKFPEELIAIRMKIDAWKMIFDVLLNMAPNFGDHSLVFWGVSCQASTAHRFAQQEFFTNSLKNESSIGSFCSIETFFLFKSAGFKRIYEIY